MHFNIKNILESSINNLKARNFNIYQNLYLSLKTAIENKTIPNDTKLPPSRVLAKDLNISRSTVLKAYELLLIEKYIISKQGAGYYVYRLENASNDTQKNDLKNYKYPSISKRAKLFKKHKYISTDNFSKDNIAFRPGLPPLDLFPVKIWKNLSNSYWRESTPTNLSYTPCEGLNYLRISISNYLKLYRNIDCDYTQIIIVSGSLHSLYLIGNTLLNKGDTVVMDNPTFPRAYNLFKSLKADIATCNVDINGMDIKSIKETSAKLIYTTPSNQYPLGIKMSLERRLDLLRWASNKNALIIEDDYDHEFSNWEHPTPSIYSLDTEDRVIYQGTFNKLLHPSLRLGYMIVPKYLIEPIKAIYGQSSRFIPPYTQQIMSEFIDRGYLNKHLRNIIKVSKERRKLFIDFTKESLEIEISNQGLHLIGKIKKHIIDTDAFKMLLKHNVVAYPLSNYYIGENKKQGLVMGYSSVNNKVMKEKTDIINSLLG